MAIGDILEGLLAGAAGGFRGYSEASRLQREEEEREAERAYRRQRDEQQDALAAALRDVQMAEMGYRVAPEMAATGATFAPEAPELMRVREDLRPTAMDIPAPARPETRDGRIRGTDVGVAPGQTYSAVQKALMDAERERPEPQPDTRVVTERGPRPIEARLTSAEERGAQAIRFPGDRTYVRERQLTPAEQREVDLEGDAADVVAAGRAMGLNLTTEQGRAVASGKVRFADLIPEAPPRGPAPTSLMQNYEFIRSQRGREEADRYLQSQMGGAGGGLDPSVVNTLQTSFNREIAEANDIASSYGRVMTAGQSSLQNRSPAANISLVFSYMRMLDPNSVVREGEYATARNAAGVPDRVRNLYNKLLTGDFLTEDQVRDFMNEADSILETTQRRYQPTIERARAKALEFGVNPDLVVYDPVEAARTSILRDQEEPSDLDRSIVDSVWNPPTGNRFMDFVDLTSSGPR